MAELRGQHGPGGQVDQFHGLLVKARLGRVPLAVAVQVVPDLPAERAVQQESRLQCLPDGDRRAKIPAGRVACDLDLLGASPAPASRWRWLDPRLPARRLASSWRIGRLRAVLPDLVADMSRRVDAELSAVGPLADLHDAELLEVLRRVSRYLAPVHGHEILAGALLP